MKTPVCGHQRARIGRWVAALCVLFLVLTSGARLVSAQDRLPLRDDDFDYAKKLSSSGFDDLATDVYERIFAKTDLTPQKKQEVGRLLVEAYRRMASKAPDSASRERYLSLAEQRVKDVSAGVTTLSPEMQYQKAKVLQTQGLSIARDLKTEQNVDKKKAMIADGAKAFDECASVLDALAADMKAKADAAAATGGDIDARAEKEKPFRDMEVKARHERAWTTYYKAQLWGPDEADYKTNMSQAVQLFSQFVDDYPTQMLMLSARYGRGLARKLIGKTAEAATDFQEIVKMIAEHADTVPEVMPLKARCAFNWAELAAADGNFDEAIAAVDKEIKENAEVEKDKDLLSLGWLTKAKVLNAKAEKLKASGKADDGATAWKDACDLLGKVIEKGGSNTAEARELLVKYVVASGRSDLTPDERVTLAQGDLSDGDDLSKAGQKDKAIEKYKRAIDVLRKMVDTPSATTSPATAFKAQRMLAIAYRLCGEYQAAKNEFESIFRVYTGKMPKEEMAKTMQQWCIALGSLARQDRKSESDKAFVDSWKRLATEYPDTPEGRDAFYYYAQALQERSGTVEAWQETAKAYTQVPAESGFYGKARYLEGVCWYNAYKVYSQKRQANTAPAQEALKTALDTLKGLFDKLPPPKPGDDWHVDAARTLADIYLDLGKPADALGVVDFVKKKFPDLASGNAKLLATLVEIYIRQGKLDEAAALLDEISAKGADPSAMLEADMKLGNAFLKRGEDAAKAGKAEEADPSFRKAGALFAKALPLVEDSVKSEPDAQKQADRQFKLNSWLVQSAYRAKDYETCIKAVDAIEKMYTDSGSPADDPLWQFRIRKLRCYQGMNLWPAEALELLRVLEEKFTNVAEIKTLRGSVLESKNQWEDALKKWEEMVPQLPQGKPEWWEANYHRCLCNYKLGRKDVANDIINKMRAVTPGMGGPEMKDRFDKLYQQFSK